MKNGISFFPWQLKSANWLYIRLVTTLLVAVGVPMAACSQPSGNNSKDEKKMADQKNKSLILMWRYSVTRNAPSLTYS